MSESVTVGSEQLSPETEAKEDPNNSKDREIWKESLEDAAENPVEEEEGEKEVETEEDKSPPGVKPDLQYSREELYNIQKQPLSQIKPEFLSDYPIQAKFSFVKGVWERSGEAVGAPAPPRERWPRSVTPNEHDGYNENKMRRGDGSRISRGKDAQQDPNYILSPQRRSFNSGCYMTGGNSLLGNRDSKVMDRDSMGQQSQARRSFGRTLPWSEPGGAESTTFVAPNLMPDYTQRRDPPPLLSQPGGYERARQGYDNGGSKYENKRMNNRNGDYNNRSNGDYHRTNGDYNRGDYNRNDYGNSRYNGMNGNERRQRNNSEKHGNDLWDEPEWFAEPTTQNDVIELRGFHDDERDHTSPEKNRKSSSNSTGSEREHRKSSSSSSGGLDKDQQPRPGSAEEKSAKSRTPVNFGAAEPNIDDLLSNLDTLPDLLSNGTVATGMDSNPHTGGSKFSRWFRKESPAPDNNSPSPHHMINDLINDITDENRPPNHNRFTPISPVFPNQQQPHRPLHSNSTSNFLDMMMKGQDGTGGIMRSGSIRDLEGVGKLHSVEELEAKMRPPTSSSSHPSHPHAGNKEEDMANFKKLMMNKLLQQQQLAQNLHSQLPPGGAGPWGNLLAAQSNSNYQELVHKMVKIQQAQEYQRRMASLGLSNNHPTPGIPPELQHHLLNNPQFDARNLVRPPLSPMNPSPEDFLSNLPQEIVLAYVIESLLEKQATASASPLSPPQPSSLPLSPGGPNFLHPAGPMGLLGQVPPTPAAQQFMMGATGTSPGAGAANNSVFQQRIPSPNQLAAHTQSILQNAIMKKKMEEQKEAMRKRHELLQRAISPGANLHHHQQQQQQQQQHILPPGHEARPSNASPVIAAFTPTSVLRKMTAAHPQEEHEKDVLLGQNHTQGQGPWGRQQPSSSLAHKTNLINLGNQQIPGQPHMSNPRSKFTLPSKASTKSSGHLAQSLADQMSMISSELNMKPAAQHSGNPFTSHHSQPGGPQVLDQLEKWFRPELLARAQAQAPLPAQNILSVEELERLASTQGRPARGVEN